MKYFKSLFMVSYFYDCFKETLALSQISLFSERRKKYLEHNCNVCIDLSIELYQSRQAPKMSLTLSRIPAVAYIQRRIGMFCRALSDH